METVKKEVERYSKNYEERIRKHPDELVTNLLNRNFVVMQKTKKVQASIPTRPLQIEQVIISQSKPE